MTFQEGSEGERHDRDADAPRLPQRRLFQREKRWPFDTPISEIKIWQEETRRELRIQAGRPSPNLTGTLAADVDRFLPLMAGLPSYKSMISNLKAWTALYGSLRRSQITSEHVRKACAPILASRLKAASETLTGRFGGWRGLPAASRGATSTAATIQ